MSSKRSYPLVLLRPATSVKKPRLEDTFAMDDLKTIYHQRNQKQNGVESQCKEIEPNYNLLPHLPLISLLEKLPLVDLLPLRAVCRRWNDFATNIVTKKRTSLSLTSYYDIEYEKASRNNNIRVRIDLSRFFDIVLTSFDFIIGIDEALFNKWKKDTLPTGVTKPQDPWGRFLYLKRNQAAKKLTVTFPAIQTLVIFDCFFTEKEIVWLLKRWCTTLISLKLVIVEKNFNWSLIFVVLKKMPQLQHLSLFSPLGFVERPKLTFLRQLKSFQMTFYTHNKLNRQCWLSHLLGQLDPNVLQHVDVGIFTSNTYKNYFFRYNLNQLSLRHPAIAAKLRRMQFPSISPSFFHFIVSRFTSVNWLDVELTSINDLKQISRLKGLKFLALRSNRRFISSCPLNQVLNKRERKTMTAIKPMVSVISLLLLDFEIDEKILKKFFPSVIKVERHHRGDNNAVDL